MDLKQAILGKWEVPQGQEYAGLQFHYHADGSFRADFPSMGVTSGGTWTLQGNELDMEQTQHSMGWVGLFRALVEIAEDGQTMKVAVAGGPGQPRPADFGKHRLYRRMA
jgi:hypothetical protein